MLRNFPHFPSRTPWYQRRARGFTLLELMAVVILIGILAVIAIPGASRAMRERRSSRAAHEIAMLYNQARARAMARGSAVLVRFNKADPIKGFEVREGIAGAQGGLNGNCLLAPSSSCTIPSDRWESDDASQRLTGFQFLGSSAYDSVDVQFNETSFDGSVASVATPTATDICMTPGGRVFYRASNNPATAFTPMTGNHSIKVWRHDTADVTIGIERFIFILPNGTARVGI